jgi:two-component system, NarL family, nitrate/nitrite response regulator NarL
MHNEAGRRTVLIVEDHPLYRGALVDLVRTVPGALESVAVPSAEEGLRQASMLPGLCLVLLDFNLPGVNGIEALTAFQRKRTGVPVVLVSASEDRQQAAAALRAGARAFVSKAVAPEVLVDIVQRLLEGRALVPEWITPDGAHAVLEDAPVALTPRQREIAQLLSQGHSNKEIGLRLGLAEITVKVHVSALFRALGVVNRTQAVLAMRRLGLDAGE